MVVLVKDLNLLALVFLIEEKSFMIYNDEQVWRFYLKDDKNFIKNGKPEKCLFWRSEESKTPKNKNKVIV